MLGFWAASPKKVALLVSAVTVVVVVLSASQWTTGPVAVQMLKSWRGALATNERWEMPKEVKGSLSGLFDSAENAHEPLPLKSRIVVRRMTTLPVPGPTGDRAAKLRRKGKLGTPKAGRKVKLRETHCSSAYTCEADETSDVGVRSMVNHQRTESRQGGAGHDEPPLRVLYNKVGKCGSRALVTLCGELARKNRFFLVGSVYGSNLHANVTVQERISAIFRKCPTPLLYHRHLHFYPVDVSPKPLYINMVRHPLDRAISSYYFRRFGDGNRSGVRGYFDPGTRYLTFEQCARQHRRECKMVRGGLWYVIPFFCGTDLLCQQPSRQALALAKERVQSEYLFVGISEHFNESVLAMEKILPRMFHGATDVLNSPISDSSTARTKTTQKVMPSEEIRAQLLRDMQLEVEFYEFVLARFYRKLDELHIPVKRKLKRGKSKSSQVPL